jgi:hypothetical protein
VKGFANAEANTAAYGVSLGRQLGASAYVAADIFVPYRGRNTRSIATGAAESEPVWSGMIAFQPGSGLSDYLVYIFATNSVGATTAMSLSASLDNQVAFGAGIMVKF